MGGSDNLTCDDGPGTQNWFGLVYMSFISMDVVFGNESPFTSFDRCQKRRGHGGRSRNGGSPHSAIAGRPHMTSMCVRGVFGGPRVPAQR